MAREPITERIRFDSPPEAVFQNFRRQSVDEVRAMPIYDFGRLLNVGAPEYLGDDRYRLIAASYANLSEQIGFRLPHPTCAVLNRYVVNELEYFFLCMGTDDGTTTLLRWFQWSLRQGWDAILTYRVAGQGDAIQRTATYQTTNTDLEHRRLLFGTTMTTIYANLYLIYERGGAVETDERPPAPTRGQTGLLRIHPMAPSSVIRIRVNDPRLLRPTEPPTRPPVSEPPTEPTEPQEPIKRNPARSTTVH